MTDPLIEKPCARGCIRPGTEDNPRHLPAKHGRYCGRCYGRINQALIQAPELAGHILGHVTSAGGADSDRIDKSKDAPLPFNQAAFTDVNELYSVLVYWCGIWADYLDQLTPAPAARSWRRDSGTVTGLPAGMNGEDAAYEVGRMCRWLRDRLDAILSLASEDIDEFDSGIRDVWRMNARWPRVDGPKYASVPCPVLDCGERLAVYPPAFGPWTDKDGTDHPGDARRIVCDGGHYHPEEEYEHLLLVLQQGRAQLAREAKRIKREGATAAEVAARVRKHLVAKYIEKEAG